MRNLFPGLILVELACYRWHRVTVLTGWLASDGFPAGQKWPSRPDRRTAAPARPGLTSRPDPSPGTGPTVGP